MKKKNLAVGPGAASMVLILVVLSMSVLGVLALIGARDAMRLSERAAVVAQTGAELDVCAERTLAGLDALLKECASGAKNDEEYLIAVSGALPEGMELDGRRIVWKEKLDGRAVECAVEIAAFGETPRLQWHTHRLVVDAEEAWN